MREPQPIDTPRRTRGSKTCSNVRLFADCQTDEKAGKLDIFRVRGRIALLSKSSTVPTQLHDMILPLATLALGVAPLIPIAIACDGCYGSQSRDITLTRHRPRMQPDAQTAVALPRGPLEWGQINFLHTTDTHGWLEGHLKEQNYGADWGDFVSFVKHINQTAVDAGVDVLLVDTGSLRL